MLVTETATLVTTISHQALILAASEFEGRVGHIVSRVFVVDCASSVLHALVQPGELLIDFVLGLAAWPVNALNQLISPFKLLDLVVELPMAAVS